MSAVKNHVAIQPHVQTLMEVIYVSVNQAMNGQVSHA